MKTPLQQLPVIILNLYDQPQKLVETKKELRYHGFENIKTVVQGERVSKPNKIRATSLMHKSAVVTAALNVWTDVLIVEDDIEFAGDGAVEYMEMAWQNLPPNYNIFCGGNYYYDRHNEPGLGYQKLRRFSGLHFYVANETIYDYILTHDYKNYIDWWMNWDGDNIHAFGVYPMCVVQKNGYSDNNECEINRSKYMEQRGYKIFST
jgi:hypothetical protein